MFNIIPYRTNSHMTRNENRGYFEDFANDFFRPFFNGSFGWMADQRMMKVDVRDEGDHFVLEVEKGTYLMYVVGVHDKKGAVSLFSSHDLLTWEYEGVALASGDGAPLRPGWGAMESPFVVKKDGLYYLFVTYTDCSDATYNDTLVFCSEDPKRFGEYNDDEPIARLYAHAPEILEVDGDYYITTCGWNGKPNPNPGCVSIAKLGWK